VLVAEAVPAFKDFEVDLALVSDEESYHGVGTDSMYD
jgi:hypothetical protein